MGLALSVGEVLPAQAQVPNLPSTVQPGRAVQQVEHLQPGQAAQPVDYTALTLEAPPNAGKLFFVLRHVIFEGNTVYPEHVLNRFFAPSMGKMISLLKVYELAQQITMKYRADGYMLARVIVPPQVIENGTLRLRILEGFVDKVEVMPSRRGERLPHGSLIVDMGEPIAHARPLTRTVLERNLLLMNTLPGVQARAVLKPSEHAPGGTDVVVLTSRKRVSGYMEADNRGSRYLGPGQASAGFTVNGVTGINDALSLQVNGTAQPSEMRAVAASYRRVLNAHGLTLNVNALQQHTRPGFLLEPFEVKGKDKSVSAGLSYPVVLRRERSDSVYGNLTIRDVDSSSLGTTLTKDHIRVLRAGYSSQGRDSLLGQDWPAANAVTLEASQGLDAFGASGRNSVTSRSGASPTFNKVNVTVSREQSLKRGAWSVYGEASGQYATKRLLTPEQFGVGGETIGSAYDSSEILGDSGFAVRGELRYLVIPPHNAMGVHDIQPYAFYDYGKVYIRRASPGQKPHPSLASTGVGARMDIGDGFKFSIEAAQPLSREVAALNSKHLRIFVKLTKTF